MKFLSSSASTDESSRNTASGCLAGVLRRLFSLNSSLKGGGESESSVACDSFQDLKPDDYAIGASATPGVVARLMGLESMPPTELADSKLNSNSIARSRSLNSVDSLRKFQSPEGSIRHRRIKSSLSFREAPTFIELEDDKFLVLSFENIHESHKFRSPDRKSEMGMKELKQRRAGKCNKNKIGKRDSSRHDENKENQGTERIERKRTLGNAEITVRYRNSNGNNLPTNNSKESSSVFMEEVEPHRPSCHKPKSEGESRRSGKKKKKKDNFFQKDTAETEYDSENSSPVSVLDFGGSSVDPKFPTSANSSDTESRLKDSNARRTLAQELKKYKHLNPNSSDLCKAKRLAGQCIGLRKKDRQGQNCAEFWGEICRLADPEMVGFSWKCRGVKKQEDYQEIGACIGSEILDQLLFDIVDHLTAHLPRKILNCNSN